MDITDPAVQERIAKFRAANRDNPMLHLGVTIYPAARQDLWKGG